MVNKLTPKQVNRKNIAVCRGYEKLEGSKPTANILNDLSEEKLNKYYNAGKKKLVLPYIATALILSCLMFAGIASTQFGSAINEQAKTLSGQSNPSSKSTSDSSQSPDNSQGSSESNQGANKSKAGSKSEQSSNNPPAPTQSNTTQPTPATAPVAPVANSTWTAYATRADRCAVDSSYMRCYPSQRGTYTIILQGGVTLKSFATEYATSPLEVTYSQVNATTLEVRVSSPVHMGDSLGYVRTYIEVNEYAEPVGRLVQSTSSFRYNCQYGSGAFASNGCAPL